MSRPSGEHPDPMDASELAALYLAGALTPREMDEVGGRLEAGDMELKRELDRVQAAGDALLGRVAAIAPPPAVRRAVFEAIDADSQGVHSTRAAAGSRQASADGAGQEAGGGVVMLLERQGRWRSTGFPGVRLRTLYADRRTNRRTILLKMDADAELPDHDHSGVEEVYIIVGDLSIGEQTLGPGDYFRAASGAKHGIARTRGGCVCIVISDYVPFPATSWLGFVVRAVRAFFPKRSTH